jgi:DHA1 family bicyclomycin/chloramphenicol resistance-like MFS transporter
LCSARSSANNPIIAELEVLATARLAAFVLLAVACIAVLLPLADLLPGMAFAGLMLAFNTSFLVVMANCASLVIDPHREMAGFAFSADRCFTQITASAAAVPTVPLFHGALPPWAASLLLVMSAVCLVLAGLRTDVCRCADNRLSSVPGLDLA